MGARLLKKWMVLPLKSKVAIDSRLEMVAYFLENDENARTVEQYLRQMGDLERLISKVPLGKVNPRELVQLKKALMAVAPLRAMLTSTGHDELAKIADGLNPCPGLVERIAKQILDEPPVNLSKGGVIADGFSTELDELRHVITHAKELLQGIQEAEIERSGIPSLKIGFNSVFGYYMEVTNKYKNQTPPEWMRKQTLANAERFITEELKALEAKILGAEERILDLEDRLFQELVLDLNDYIQPVQHNATLLARLDCIIAFAKVATRHQYCRPQLSEGLEIDIREGRHPVIEQQLPLGELYVPNDVYLDHEHQQILMITGPNMAGKSALLRQTALICLMAQMGAYVPAKSAHLGILDKVFTRVGASDNISSGESTFMVEMNETASIMNNISDRSLILLDEIGRGTSTYDGISIAWSIAEYLHNNPLARPKTLFATHYHELNELSEKFSRIKNYHVATKEVGQKVIFLRKLTAGGSQHSFGIHVAKMAGMPKMIVERANHILEQLEQKSINQESMHADGPNVEKPKTKQINTEALQLSIFETVDPMAGQIKALLQEVDINTMTPIDCMLKLRELKGMIE